MMRRRLVSWVTYILIVGMIFVEMVGCSNSITTTPQEARRTTELFLIDTLGEVDASDSGNAWILIGLLRSSSNRDLSTYTEAYYDNLRALLKSEDGVLSDDEITAYEHTILALRSMDVSPNDVDGTDLTKALDDIDAIRNEGIHAEIYALITANDAGITLTHENDYIEDILGAQSEDGSFLFDNEPSIDITSAALQAFSFYMDNEDVAKSIDRMKSYLSEHQSENGGYSTSEETSQVIIALTMVDVDIENDDTYIKNGNSLVDGLLSFYTGEGFSHQPDGETDRMASWQALLALDALDLQENGEKLYGGKHE